VLFRCEAIGADSFQLTQHGVELAVNGSATGLAWNAGIPPVNLLSDPSLAPITREGLLDDLRSETRISNSQQLLGGAHVESIGHYRTGQDVVREHAAALANVRVRQL
jgi:hypothetical protein